jgi:metal-dependent hydrolase (beta-lactamase superfamily II)
MSGTNRPQTRICCLSAEYRSRACQIAAVSPEATNRCRDTGNDRDIFAANVKAKGIDLNQSRVVLSHRHSDHMAGLSHVPLPNDERPPP